MPRYVPNPSTTADFQGDTVVSAPAPSFEDVVYLPGGIGPCWTGDEADCVSTFRGEQYRGSHTLDVYEPGGVPGSDRPVIVWIHGGFAVRGDKDDLGDPEYPSNLLARQLARGYVVVAMNYRLNIGEQSSTGLRFETTLDPVSVEDTEVAVRFLQANAATFGIDPDRIVLWGHSWGAYTAQMLATTGGLLAPSWMPPELAAEDGRIAGAVSEAGPGDLPTTLPVALQHVIGTGEFGTIDTSGFDAGDFAPYSPSQFVDAGDAPIYAIYGSQDPIIPVADGEVMADRYEALGRSDLFRLDIVDDSGDGPMPWSYRTHVPHPGANRTELEQFLDTLR